jgi:hypothetical protein
MPVAEGSNDLLVNGIGMLTGPGIGSFARGGGRMPSGSICATALMPRAPSSAAALTGLACCHRSHCEHQDGRFRRSICCMFARC